MSDKLPGFIRRDVERAMQDALAPKGMSVHDGKAKIGCDKLNYLLGFIDRSDAELERLRTLTQQQAEQIAKLQMQCGDHEMAVSCLEAENVELVEYAKELREALESAQLSMRIKQPVYTNGTITGYSFLSDANVNAALAKPMPKAMENQD